MAEKLYPAIVAKYENLYFDIIPKSEIDPVIAKMFSNPKSMKEFLTAISKELVGCLSIKYNEENKSIDIIRIINPWFDDVELTNFRKGVSFPFNQENILSRKDFLNELDRIYKKDKEENFSLIGVGLARE